MKRTPPWSEESERALLAAMLQSVAAREAAQDLSPGDFYSTRHQLLFTAILAIHHRGGLLDPIQLVEELRRAGTLEKAGGRAEIRKVQASSGVGYNAARYALAVAELATARRAITLAEDLAEAAYASDLESIQRLVDTAAERLDAPVEQVVAEEASTMAATSEWDRRPWALHGYLKVRDRFGLSGPEGHGKMSLLRQFAVCAASGLTPFTLESVPHTPALIVDLQEDRDELGDQLRWILKLAGTAYNPADGYLHAIPRSQGMNLLARSDRRWLEGLIRAHRPSLLVIGPLRKLYRAPERFGKSSEEAADELTRIFDDLRVSYDMAVAIEGHAGHDRETWRFRGSSVWLDWFNFGFGLNPLRGERNEKVRRTGMMRWRGDRPPGRPWPRMLIQGAAMPWEDADQPPLGNAPLNDAF